MGANHVAIFTGRKCRVLGSAAINSTTIFLNAHEPAPLVPKYRLPDLPDLQEHPRKIIDLPIEHWLRGPLRGWAESLLAEAGIS